MIGVASDLRSRIELARGEVPAPLNRSVVSHLDNQGACRALRTVKDRAFASYEEEQVLDKIVRFGGVSQDTISNTANDSRVSLEEKPQSLLITLHKARK
jgi:hypothetical protein